MFFITLKSDKVNRARIERFLTDERRLEESLRAPKSLISNGDNLAIRQLIRLLEGAGASSSLHLLFEIKSNVAQLLLKNLRW